MKYTLPKSFLSPQITVCTTTRKMWVGDNEFSEEYCQRVKKQYKGTNRIYKPLALLFYTDVLNGQGSQYQRAYKGEPIATTTKLKDNIRSWYCMTYKSDGLGSHIDSHATFQDIFDCLDARGNIYDTIGIFDSVVRERIFEELAKVIGEDYNYIYSQYQMA